MANTKNILIGLGLVALGCFSVWHTYKYPVKNDNTASNLKGYTGGFSCIILGIIILFNSIEW